MHEIRSSILGGADKAPAPVSRTGKPKDEAGGLGGLTRIAIRREEARVTNQRSEDRVRGQVEQSVIHFRRRKHAVRVVNVSSRGAMIEGDVEPRIGETIEVQFADDHRTRCIVRWVRDGRVGLEFVDETIVWDCGAPGSAYRERPHAGNGQIEQSLPRAVVEREARQTLLRAGTLYWSGVIIPVCLRNISPQGANVESEQELRAGSKVELDLGEAGFQVAEVRWSRDGQVGLRFADDFDLGALAPAAEDAEGQAPYLETELRPDSPWAARFEQPSRTDPNPTGD